MKRTWMVVFIAALLAVPAVAAAQDSTAEPVAAWCGGSYGAAGTNFGQCVPIESKTRVAGAGGGIREQTVMVPTTPEYPATAVAFEGTRVVFDTGNVDRDGRPIKREITLRWEPTPVQEVELQAPGNE